MPKIQNTEAIKAIRDSARLSVSEGFPQELDTRVVPVIDMSPIINKEINVVRSQNSTASGAVNIYTTNNSGGYRFYLKSIYFAMIKDSNCDVANGVINVTANVDGVNRTLVAIPVLTTTAQNEAVYIYFNTPVKLDLGATITMAATFTLGAMARTCTITGYEQDY